MGENMEYTNKKDLLATINVSKARVIYRNDIIHCKECKYWKCIGYDPILEVNFGACQCEQWANDLEYPETSATDFCSYGRREKDE